MTISEIANLKLEVEEQDKLNHARVEALVAFNIEQSKKPLLTQKAKEDLNTRVEKEITNLKKQEQTSLDR